MGIRATCLHILSTTPLPSKNDLNCQAQTYSTSISHMGHNVKDINLICNAVKDLAIYTVLQVFGEIGLVVSEKMLFKNLEKCTAFTITQTYWPLWANVLALMFFLPNSATMRPNLSIRLQLYWTHISEHVRQIPAFWVKPIKIYKYVPFIAPPCGWSECAYICWLLTAFGYNRFVTIWILMSDLYVFMCQTTPSFIFIGQ